MKPDEEIRSIVLVRLSAIGDVVHTLPLLHSLRARYPQARISWIIQQTPLELVRGVQAADEWIPFQRRPLLAGLWRLRRQLRGRQFDLTVVPQPSLKAALVAAVIPSPRKMGFDRARSPELGWLATAERIAPAPVAHFADEILQFADHLGAERVQRWDIGPTSEEKMRWGHLLEGDKTWIAMAPASSRPDKDWPADRYAELAEAIAEGGLGRMALIGGRSEREDRIAAEIVSRCSAPILDLRANDLRRLATLASEADLVVGSDSAPVHIAAAVGTPVVALFGTTNPARYAPTASQAIVVDAYHEAGEVPDPARSPRPGRMQRIAVAQVLEAVRSQLAHSASPAHLPEPADDAAAG